jgi:WD40 repeat protein
LAAGERLSGSVKLFDVMTGKLAKSLEHHTRRDRVRALAFSPDRRFVLSGADDGLAKLWNVETGELLRTFEHGNNVHAGVFLPDGEHFLTSSKEGRSVVLWNIDSNQGVPVANNAETSEKGLELFPDGGKFITSHACFQLPAGPPRPGVIQLWRIPQNALVKD